MATRSVSLVNKIELDFQGNIFKNAIDFGDVDGDGKHELVIANTAGQLFVFKGRSQKPWKVCQGLGCVTVVAVGDIKNDGTNHILCLNTEGNCFLFNQIQDKESFAIEKVELKVTHSKSSKSLLGEHAERISPSYKQLLHANAKMALIADVDGDGLNELTVCYTDRCVRIFKWDVIRKRTESKPQKDDEVTRVAAVGSVKKHESKLVKQPSKDEEGKAFSVTTNTLVKQPSKDSGVSGNPSPRSPVVENVNRKDSSSKQIFVFNEEDEGKFNMIQEFHLPEQVGSVALTKQLDGKIHLIASQPAGGYAVLAVNDSQKHKIDGNSVSPVEAGDSVLDKDINQTEQPLIFHPMASYRLRNFKVDSEVLGCIRRENDLTGLFCICTVDGSYLLIDNSQQGATVLPSSTITEHKWFSCNSLDLNMDGNDVIVICSWDGMTYVINKNLETVSYNFGDTICGFRAGFFAVDADVNVPCFCYVTFSNRLILYHGVNIINRKSKNLQDVLIEKLKKDEKYKDLLTGIQNEAGDIDKDILKKLVGLASH